ncbi:hypothetical protein [Sphingomonas qomolangmaensis]|uniref:Uncharacterized protein n=1 Tax=Sphingomonas qomolangmaensis TaxID=2918765 RepID=A0ABY5LB38_9SPHN|nr:hypothetical protein [Sphingomonas qomolangmaensis]UUL82934.1 hypothetical protein NMP03_01450 [Sphingomonas qomolangmaensis]
METARLLSEGVIADFTGDGTLVWLYIDGASRFDRGSLETTVVPLVPRKAA